MDQGGHRRPARPIHPLTGPIFVEGAEPGDVLAVTLHEIEVGDWGWVGIFPGFGWLADEHDRPYLKTFEIGAGASEVRFADGISLSIAPFPGVMGVAEAERGLSRDDAYVLCSLAGDLKISEVVDVPHVLVSMHLPKSIFDDG